MEDLILGIEEEIPVFEEELKVALENIAIHAYNLERIDMIHSEVLVHGVSRASMESLASIYPDALPPQAAPYTFTVMPSQNNIDYAQEGFFGAIAKAIKWVFTQLIEAIKAVCKLVVSIIKWLFNYEEDSYKGYGGKKKVQRLFERADQIEEEYRELQSRLNNELPPDRVKTVPQTSKTLEEKFTEVFGTQLDYDLVNGDKPGLRITDLIDTLNAILVQMEKGIERIERRFVNIESIYEEELYNKAITSTLKNVRSSFYEDEKEGKKYFDILLPYNYTMVMEMIVDNGGKMPPNHLDIVRKDKGADPTWYLTDTSKNLDLFWKGKVADRYGKLVNPIVWNGSDEGRVYGAGHKEKIKLKYNYEGLIKRNPEHVSDLLDKTKKASERLLSKAEYLDEKIKDYTKNLTSISTKWGKYVSRRGDYDPLMIVWPEKDAGKIAEHQSDGIVNPDAVSKIMKSSDFWSPQIKAVTFLYGPVMDVTKCIQRYQKIIEYITKLLYEREKDNDRMETALGD